MNKKTFKRLTPLAKQLGDVLGGKNAEDVSIAIGMIVGLNSDAPEDLEYTLDLIKESAIKFRIYTMEEGQPKNDR